ncbi:NAD(P)H-hydrate dehydratase [Chelativorans sp. ZYF759]|uniref:NAD(P)H-hydrate dehydratase n=1 Tax=Chelativorans sp. ZYF759 TaxID=2692213 RepID=UPI00145F55D4|nr:NAD(P)H-hydrate dehydratase [Chelativorans sp. ZYF759]NMG38636.1 NAD(P)H-hydrate dehydratase [Chelativorans sp. ZYF759]
MKNYANGEKNGHSSEAHALLTPDEMARADQLAIAGGGLDGYGLMLNAGRAIAAEILSRHAEAAGLDVLCGPGNNGGDGYVVARLLAEGGLHVRVWALGVPGQGSDAARARQACPVEAAPLASFAPAEDRLVVDALFGAGLSKPLAGDVSTVIGAVEAAGSPVVAVDLPSGISGETGQAMGAAFDADLTVTFFRLKPGHLLMPGRRHCGTTVVADIGIPDSVLDEIGPRAFRNGPALWAARLPRPEADTHKYRRGHVGVMSGGPSATGAARLAAMGAARAGAGAVTLLSPSSAVLVNAAHLTAIMLRRTDSVDDLSEFVKERKPAAFVLGPGAGVNHHTRTHALELLAMKGGPALVLDADGITACAAAPDTLFAAAETSAGLVLTPHEGEFGRLFPDINADSVPSKLERARRAAARASGVVVLKGADTVVAAPDGRAVINANGTPLLATAGSGDVLAGLIAGLIAQGMPTFEAACAAVWIHADAGRRFGPGLIAEDLPGLVPGVLRELMGE